MLGPSEDIVPKPENIKVGESEVQDKTGTRPESRDIKVGETKKEEMDAKPGGKKPKRDPIEVDKIGGDVSCAKLKGMFKAERAAKQAWRAMSFDERRVYAQAKKGSRFAATAQVDIGQFVKMSAPALQCLRRHFTSATRVASNSSGDGTIIVYFKVNFVGMLTLDILGNFASCFKRVVSTASRQGYDAKLFVQSSSAKKYMVGIVFSESGQTSDDDE